MLLVKEKGFYKTLFKIALPAAFQSLVSIAVNMLDNVMVAAVGETELSAVSLSNNLITFLTTMIISLANGSSVLVSQYWGKKDTGKIKSVFAIVMQICLALGVISAALIFFFPSGMMRIFTNDGGLITAAVPYISIVSISLIFFSFSNTLTAALRYVEMVRVTLYISMSTLVSNLLFNYILIFGKLGLPAMGVEGAALATVISRAIECIVVFIYVFAVQKQFPMRIRELFKSEKSLWIDYIKYGLPVAIGDTSWALIGAVKAGIIGRLGQEMVAANSIADNVLMLGNVFTRSMAAGACVIVGKAVGQEDYPAARQYSKTIQFLFFTMGIGVAALVFFLRMPAISLFGNISETTASLANTFIIIGAITLVGTCYHAACFLGINRGGGDSRFVFIVDMICGWGVVLPLMALGAFVFNFSLPMIFLMSRIDQCYKWLIAFIRLRGNKWIKNVTRA